MLGDTADCNNCYSDGTPRWQRPEGQWSGSYSDCMPFRLQSKAPLAFGNCRNLSRKVRRSAGVHAATSRSASSAATGSSTREFVEMKRRAARSRGSSAIAGHCAQTSKALRRSLGFGESKSECRDESNKRLVACSQGRACCRHLYLTRQRFCQAARPSLVRLQDCLTATSQDPLVAGLVPLGRRGLR